MYFTLAIRVYCSKTRFQVLTRSPGSIAKGLYLSTNSSSKSVESSLTFSKSEGLLSILAVSFSSRVLKIEYSFKTLKNKRNVSERIHTSFVLLYMATTFSQLNCRVVIHQS